MSQLLMSWLLSSVYIHVPNSGTFSVVKMFIQTPETNLGLKKKKKKMGLESFEHVYMRCMAGRVQALLLSDGSFVHIFDGGS